MIDGVDRRILAAISENARMATSEIAKRIDASAIEVADRIRRLEQQGVILGYSVRLSHQVAGAGLLAFAFVRPAGEDPGPVLARMPEVEEVHRVAGDDGYIIKLRVNDTEALGRLLESKLDAIGSLSELRTTVVLRTLK